MVEEDRLQGVVEILMNFMLPMGDTIQSDDIQLTIQGQTISSNFGTLDSSQYNLEQLLSSGIENPNL